VVTSFARGANYARRGLSLVVGTPALWKLVFWPFLLSLLALGGLIYGIASWHDETVRALTPGGWIGSVIGPVVRVLYWLIIPFLAWFLYLPIVSILAGPFNEAIAEAVERLRLGGQGGGFSLATLIRDLGLTVVHELRKFVRWLLLALGVFLLSVLVPGVGSLIGIVGGGYLAARFAAWDALDYTLSRRAFGYADKQAFLRSRRSLCLGLGGSIAGLLLIPVLGALAMPAGAAAGALLVHDELGPAGS
jgi:CysZ protein